MIWHEHTRQKEPKENCDKELLEIAVIEAPISNEGAERLWDPTITSPNAAPVAAGPTGARPRRGPWRCQRPGRGTGTTSENPVGLELLRRVENCETPT